MTAREVNYLQILKASSLPSARKMSNKIPSHISALLTITLLIVLAALSIFFEMVALNGFSGRQGGTAMGVSLVCQGVFLILAGIFAAWFTNLLIIKFNWNQVLAVVAAVTVSTLLSGIAFFLCIIVAILLAGVL
jgi:small-conductance mechanosensitive channel